MSKYGSLIRGIIILCLLSVNLFPFIGLPNVGESGAPDGNGITNTHWYISSTDDVLKQDKTYWTKDITINGSGKMTWDKDKHWTKDELTQAFAKAGFKDISAEYPLADPDLPPYPNDPSIPWKEELHTSPFVMIAASRS